MSKKNLLMVRTKDKRRFFTHQKNLPMLVEFAKTFNAELLVVKGDKLPALDLEKLAPAICDSSYDTDVEFEVVSKVYPKAERQRQRTQLLTNAQSIKDYIRTNFTKQQAVSLKELKTKFQDLNVTDSCLCHHLKVVREELQGKGMTITKVGAGKYAIK